MQTSSNNRDSPTMPRPVPHPHRLSRGRQVPDGIVGHAPSFAETLERIDRVGATDATVLITGETGTGKELVARAIHRRSRRSSHAMVCANLAALPKGLVATELFGHEAGAFTGAVQKRIGRFEAANASTLFLDEVGEVPPCVQVMLLRALQEGEFERIGSNRATITDVRVIAATNRNLEDAVGVQDQELSNQQSSVPLVSDLIADAASCGTTSDRKFPNRHEYSIAVPQKEPQQPASPRVRILVLTITRSARAMSR